MSALLSMLKTNGAANAKLLAGPILIVLVLGMMVLPLPTFLLDLLFTFNIALSVMILLVAMFTRKPLDFAAFPSVLLFATLLRLSLNVASTRVVLLNGHQGPDAAGKVIEAFGHFLVGGNFAVGIILFVILTIINFIVITKGAGRIAEVGARFTLDAMPGKQMAIDADLNAGLIGEDEARKRRAEVAQESDFFGSMDGASKFVRGDAIAGLLIMVINVIGGLIVGVAQHDLSVGESARVYTLLTIGDGLVAQIPALVISTAAGVVVSRVATDQDVGQQILSQLFSNPNVMFLTAAIVGIMGLIPNMPHLAFLTLAALLAGCGWMVYKRNLAAASQAQQPAETAAAQAQAAASEATWEDVSMVDQLGLEVGYRLIRWSTMPRTASCCTASAACARNSPRTWGSCRRWCTSATTWNSSRTTTASCFPAWKSVAAWPCLANGWPSTRAAWPCRSRARPPPTRPSACRRCGSTAASATKPRWPATRWSTQAPWWLPT
ncbi:hypothetical protein FYB25_03495 [Bordetella parapertussis]|nr:hypothetical protein FYB25_03495 [Bordetella parapertussis]